MEETMFMQSLSGEWQFKQTAYQEWLPARVPGGVHTDLLALDQIPDPFVGDNEKKVMWVAEQDWEYRKTFTVDPDLLREEQLFLVCDGLDTLARVMLNGNPLGQAANLFRRYTWDIKAVLQPGENELRIVFPSTVNYCAQRQAGRPMMGVNEALEGSAYARKAPCHFGWDWGPMLPPIGIWQDIRLEGRSTARLDDIHLRQSHADGKVTITAAVTTTTWKDTPLTARLQLTAPSGDTVSGTVELADGAGILQVEVPNPQLWWPNGYGEQPLYTVEVVLMAGDTACDQRSYTLGLRTIKLLQEDDQWGRSFTFFVNGKPIFAKGANWIPADSFLTRFPDEALEKLITDAVAANQNMLRVWGGGLYEEERFYDLCDRYGILVWQDFVFSCGIYPLDETDFVENLHQEVIENVRRLRHRASLALWCGNNEMEWGWESWGWARPEYANELEALAEKMPVIKDMLWNLTREPLEEWRELQAAYDTFFHTTLPEWVAGLDPDTDYWPSSPSSDTPFYNVNGNDRGDAHYWDVWHGRKPFTAYRTVFPRFMSEFGFQALPTLDTVEFYAEEADRNMTSYIMEHHQRGNHGNGLIVAQLTETFRMPKDFAALVYLSLVLQAEGIRYGVEHWRRHLDRVSGILYWQLNDCWPVASWASIDYFGRWKALHYAAKRFYAPVMLSILDEPPQMGLYVTNDSHTGWQGTLRWSLETLSGEVLDSGREPVSAGPYSVTAVRDLDFAARVSDDNEREVVLVAELWQGETRLGLNVANFIQPKHLSLVDPVLSAELQLHGEQLVIDLTAQSLAHFVELKLAGADVVFSDNYFSIPAGRTIRVTCPLPQGWSLARAQEALQLYSLYNSFA
jgi:beta-mannosidase